LFEAPLAPISAHSRGLGFEPARQFAQHGFGLGVASADDVIHVVKQRLSECSAEVRTVRFTCESAGNDLERLRSTSVDTHDSGCECGPDDLLVS
jgi:hypothetical protein